MDQLTLNVALLDTLSFDTFYSIPDNRDIVSLLQSPFWRDFPQLVVYGDSGSGKSHLLQACCKHAQSNSDSAAGYFSMRELSRYEPDVMQGSNQYDLLILDDIDVVLGNRVWEEALFHLINQRREQQNSLLFSACTNPHDFNCQLPDLASRLLWGPIYQLNSLNETQALEAFRWRAMQRGIKVTNQVAEFINKRYPRDIHSLIDILNQLDKASFNRNKKVTRKLVADTLQ